MLFQVTSPTLIVDKMKCIQNIKSMVSKAQKLGLQFRPHFKTHQSAEIGEWFKEYGVKKITVSSVSMAEYFAQAGWEDILIAFPVNVREIDKINQLAASVHLSLLVESEEVIRFLSEHLRKPVEVYIKIDVGYHRTGIDPENTDLLDRLISLINASGIMQWKGFLTHAGQTYSARGRDEVLEIHQHNLKILNKLRNYFKEKYNNFIISYGDTPSCTLAEQFDGIDEIRPGNFVYYDVMQWRIGSCRLEDIAVAVACPVVAKHKERNEVVIYGGAVHLSKDSVEMDDGQIIFGLGVWLNERGWEIPHHPIPVVRLSQEHGILKVPDSEWARIRIGDLMGILPVHSCLSADLLRGNQVILNK